MIAESSPVQHMAACDVGLNERPEITNPLIQQSQHLGVLSGAYEIGEQRLACELTVSAVKIHILPLSSHIFTTPICGRLPCTA